MKFPLRFSIGFLLVVVALVAGYLGGRQRGEESGFAAVTAAATNIKVIATVLRGTAEGSSVIAVEHFEVPSGEKMTLSGGDLGDIAIDIVPHRFELPVSLSGNLPITTEVAGDGTEMFANILPLQNASVLDVSEAMTKDLSKECKNGAAIVKSEIVSNSLILKSNSKAHLGKMMLMAKSFDIRPTSFKAKLMVSRKNPDGSVRYLSKPTIMTIEGRLGLPASNSVEFINAGLTVRLQMYQEQPGE